MSDRLVNSLNALVPILITSYSGHKTVAAPVYVSENLLKKRKNNEKNAAVKARQRLDLRKVIGYYSVVDRVTDS